MLRKEIVSVAPSPDRIITRVIGDEPVSSPYASEPVAGRGDQCGVRSKYGVEEVTKYEVDVEKDPEVLDIKSE